MIHGTCGRCGGPVETPDFYHSIVPPTPTCRRCGATVARHGRLLEMAPGTEAAQIFPLIEVTWGNCSDG